MATYTIWPLKMPLPTFAPILYIGGSSCGFKAIDKIWPLKRLLPKLAPIEGIVPENPAFAFRSGLTPTAIDPRKSVAIETIVMLFKINLVLGISSPMNRLNYCFVSLSIYGENSEKKIGRHFPGRCQKHKELKSRAQKD